MPQAEIITTRELEDWINQGRRMTLLDVLDETSYVCGHVPTAQNACVYEVAFVDKVRQIQPDTGEPVVVYATAQGSRAAHRAAEKLLRAGYGQVYVFEGGLDDWAAAGHPLEGQGGEPEPLVRDGTYDVDVEQSRILWAGRNVNIRHNGLVVVKQGFLEVAGGLPVKGEVEADLTRMSNQNLTDPGLAAMLLAHLQSDDFFDVANHPLARFVLTKAVARAEVRGGQPNVDLHGRMFIRGIERDMTVPAVFEAKDPGVVALECHFDLERTLFGVDYGSASIYQRLGKHLVHDFVSIEVRLVALGR